MNLAQSKPIRAVFEAFAAARRKPLLGLAIVGLDVAFILFYGLFAPLREQAGGAALLSAAQNMREFAQLVNPPLSALLTGTHANVFVSALALLLIATFAGYVAIQATAWWLAYRIAGVKRAYAAFISRFALVSLPFFLAAAFLVLLRIVLAFRARALAQALGGIVAEPFWPVVALVIMGYLALIVTATLRFAALRHAFNPALLASAGLLAVVVLVADFLLARLGALGTLPLLAGGFLVFFPLIALGKIYAVIACKHALRP